MADQNAVHPNKMKPALIVGAVIVVIIVIAIIVGSQKSSDDTTSTSSKQADTSAATDTDSSTSNEATAKNASVKTQQKVRAAFDNKKYDDLASLASSGGVFFVETTGDTDDTGSGDKAVAALSSYLDAQSGLQTPWTFKVADQALATQLKTAVLITGTDYVGVSKDGDYFVAVTFDVDGTISAIKYGQISKQ